MERVMVTAEIRPKMDSLKRWDVFAEKSVRRDERQKSYEEPFTLNYVRVGAPPSPNGGPHLHACRMQP
jgi:hypothetical protein